MTNPKSMQKMLMLYITAVIKCVNKFINVFIIKELSAIIVSENVSLKEGLHKSIHETVFPRITSEEVICQVFVSFPVDLLLRVLP